MKLLTEKPEPYLYLCPAAVLPVRLTPEAVCKMFWNDLIDGMNDVLKQPKPEKSVYLVNVEAGVLFSVNLEGSGVTFSGWSSLAAEMYVHVCFRVTTILWVF